MSESPKVCFYPLDQSDREQVLLFACRLVEKARSLGHSVHLLSESDTEARQLDDLLWHFRPDSFLPHTLLTADRREDDTGVTVGAPDQQPLVLDVLVNLHGSIWEHHGRFRDIRDLVPADDSGRQLGRDRYRHYQDLGYALDTR
jgi:DNA polymerase-3 subunit chi